jgi:type II secretory pathway pseudopilin PulG
MKSGTLLAFVAVCLAAVLLVVGFGLWFKQQQKLVAFQERLHMVERSLSVYKQTHGTYPNSLAQLDANGFAPVLALSGATYQYRTNAPPDSNEILLDGTFRGHSFEIREKTGVSFR